MIRTKMLFAFRLRGKEGVPMLASALEDENRYVRSFAAENLRLLGPLAIDAVPSLEAALDDGDPRVRAAAKNALLAIDAKRFRHLERRID
jgi:HEAT repeat protein